MKGTEAPQVISNQAQHPHAHGTAWSAVASLVLVMASLVVVGCGPVEAEAGAPEDMGEASQELATCGTGLYCTTTYLYGATQCQSGSQTVWCCPYGQRFANGACVPPLSVPTGYSVHTQTSSKNVTVYRYTTNTSKVWYVTAVHNRSTRVRSLIGAIHAPDNSLFVKSQGEFWTQARELGAPVAVVNMAFSGYSADRTRAGIAFGLKVPDPGYFAGGYEAADRYILGWNSLGAVRVWDSPDGASDFDPAGYTNAAGGLSVNVCKRCTDVTGRTFVGYRGDYLLIFSAQNATSEEARREFSRWAPTVMMQHDGGGSSFLTVNGSHLVTTDGRRLPHAVAFYP